MVNHNINAFAYSIIILALCTYGGIFIVTQYILNTEFNKLTHVSTTISINIPIWLIFIKWAWKWKIFYPWLVQIPNLSGTWNGNIESNWDNKPKSIPITINISQSFLHTLVILKTNESTSRTIAAAFNIDKARGYQQLIYSYSNEVKTNIREKSSNHYGSAILNFTGFLVKEMDGEYWTTRKTAGQINIEKIV